MRVRYEQQYLYKGDGNVYMHARMCVTMSGCTRMTRTPTIKHVDYTCVGMHVFQRYCM